MKKYLQSFYAFLTILQQIVHVRAMQSTTQMLTSSVYRPRMIVTPIVLDFSYFNYFNCS